MPFNKVQDASGNVVYELSPKGSSDSEFVVRFEGGVEGAIGRGTGSIVYLRVTNADGEDVFISANATQDGVVISGTKP